MMLKEALALRRGKTMPEVEAKKMDGLAPSPEKEEGPEHGEKVMEAEGKEASNLSKLAVLVKGNPEAEALVALMIKEQGEEMAEEGGKHGGDEEEGQESEDEGDEEMNPMVAQMSDYEKEDLMKREKPRSLGERAKMMALKK